MKHFTKMSLLGMLILTLSPKVSFAESYWSKGAAPQWVKSCQEFEKQGVAHQLKDYNPCNSKGYQGYVDDLDQYGYLDQNGGYIFLDIESVHVVVTDFNLDFHTPDFGDCESESCYRAYVYINGDQDTGTHVATWVTTPGMPWADGTGNYTPESSVVYQTSRKSNQNSKGHFMLQLDHEMGLGGDVTAKIKNHYVMDHYVNSNGEDMPWATFYHFGIAFHSSGHVDGEIGSHGCTRLKYIESKKMNFLARTVGRKFTVETRFTEVEKMSAEEREKVILLEQAAKNMKEYTDLVKRAEQGDLDAASQLRAMSINGGGGLY